MASNTDLILAAVQLGGQLYAEIAKNNADKEAAEIAAMVAAGAQRVLEAEAGGPLDELTNEQLLQVMANLGAFPDPEVAAKGGAGGP